MKTSIKQHSIKKYGWIPDRPDHRDLIAPTSKGINPPKVDLRPQCPPEILNQGELGSCTANAIAIAFQFELMKQKSTVFLPSRLFIYYNERVMEGTVNSDSGAMIRDGIKSCVKQGAPPETNWGYDINKFTKKPDKNVYSEAMKHQVQSYARVNQNLNDIKSVLASGYPIVFGFTVYAGFESDEVAKTGIVKMPEATEENLGGHAVCMVGYDDSTKHFIVRNSWGQDWGDKGYFYLPYDYVTNPNLADDFWTIKLIEKA